MSGCECGPRCLRVWRWASGPQRHAFTRYRKVQDTSQLLPRSRVGETLLAAPDVFRRIRRLFHSHHSSEFLQLFQHHRHCRLVQLVLVGSRRRLGEGASNDPATLQRNSSRTNKTFKFRTNFVVALPKPEATRKQVLHWPGNMGSM